MRAITNQPQSSGTSSRERFEAKLGRGYYLDRDGINYQSTHTQCAWEAWQARDAEVLALKEQINSIAGSALRREKDLMVELHDIKEQLAAAQAVIEVILPELNSISAWVCKLPIPTKSASHMAIKVQKLIEAIRRLGKQS